jgi:hypothetical protein
MQYNSASVLTTQKKCTSELTNEKLLIFTSQLHRLICLVTLCLCSITYSFAQDNTDCNAILTHGIYNYDEIKSNSQYQRDYLNYLYEANFQSSSQATAAGIDLSVPIPGTDIILGGSGNFDSKKYQEWRHTYSTTQTEHVKYDQAYARVRSYISVPLIQAWTTCVMKNEPGVVIGFYPIDDKKVELRTRYAPGSDGISDARLTTAPEIIGGTLATPASANGLRKNAILTNAIKSVTLNRKPGQTLKVTLHTNRGDKSLTYPAPPVGVIVRFVASPSQLYTGDVASLSWETNALGDIKLDNEAVNATDSRTIKPIQSTTYTLTGKTVTGTVATQKVTVNVVPRPRTIVSGEVDIEVPAWADGKDDDTNISFAVKTQTELLIADGSKWGPGDKLELDPGTGTIVMTMRTTDIPTLTIDNLPRIHFSVHKHPNGGDKMTFAAHGRFHLSDGTLATFNTDYLRLQDNDPQSWDGFLNVSFAPATPQPIAMAQPAPSTTTPTQPIAKNTVKPRKPKLITQKPRRRRQ